MKKLVLVMLLAVFMGGCATGGAMNPLPRIANPENAVEITVIRESAFMSGGLNYYVTFDDIEIFSIKNGEHTRFKVPNDKHTIAVRCFGGFSPTMKESMIEIMLEPKTKVYYLISPSAAKCATIEPLKPQDAEAWIAKTTFRSFE